MKQGKRHFAMTETNPEMKHFRFIRDVIVLKNKNKLVKKLQEEAGYPTIHGHKVWHSSYLIMDYLDHFPIEEKSRVMEVGAGWGILSIYLNKTFQAKVTAVDADKNVFPFLQLHAKLNEAKVKTKVKEFSKVKKEKFKKIDYIFGGDICFWDELTDDLFILIKRAMSAGVKKIVIADPGRSPFLKLHKKCKKLFNTELYEWDADEPNFCEGYLMVITQ